MLELGADPDELKKIEEGQGTVEIYDIADIHDPEFVKEANVIFDELDRMLEEDNEDEI